MARRMIATATHAIGSSSSRYGAWRNTNASNMPRKTKRVMPVNRAANPRAAARTMRPRRPSVMRQSRRSKYICAARAPPIAFARGLDDARDQVMVIDTDETQVAAERIRREVRIRIGLDEHEASFAGQPEVESRIVPQLKCAKRFRPVVAHLLQHARRQLRQPIADAPLRAVGAVVLQAVGREFRRGGLFAADDHFRRRKHARFVADDADINVVPRYEFLAQYRLSQERRV